MNSLASTLRSALLLLAGLVAGVALVVTCTTDNTDGSAALADADGVGIG